MPDNRWTGRALAVARFEFLLLLCFVLPLLLAVAASLVAGNGFHSTETYHLHFSSTPEEQHWPAEFRWQAQDAVERSLSCTRTDAREALGYLDPDDARRKQGAMDIGVTAACTSVETHGPYASPSPMPRWKSVFPRDQGWGDVSLLVARVDISLADGWQQRLLQLPWWQPWASLALLMLLYRKQWLGQIGTWLGKTRQEALRHWRYLPLPLLVSWSCAWLLDWNANEQAAVQMYRQFLDDSLIGTVLLIVVAAPLFEELLFRGAGWRILGGAFSPGIVLAITSLSFAAAHIQYTPAGMMGVAMVGMSLGWIRYRTDSVGCCVLAHAVVNSTAVVSLLAFHAP